MDNEFEEYCVVDPYEWHSYEIGEYHITDVGTSHADLLSKKHYGPCLRNSYWEYTDDLPFSLISEGNFLIGNIIHEIIQKTRKENQPFTIVEFPISHYIELVYLDEIRIVGSVDLVEFLFEDGKKILRVTDIKTASNWTMPNSPYSFNPTYITQVYLYTYILSEFYFQDIFDEIEMEILYINKNNMSVHRQKKIYDVVEAERIYDEFVERCFNLHRHLTDDELPEPEPMRWCKYCKNLERCIERGGIVYDEENRCYVLDD